MVDSSSPLSVAPLLLEMLLLLLFSSSGVLLGLVALLRKSSSLATVVVVGSAFSGGAMLGTALLSLFPDAVDVSRPLACAGVLVGLMTPLLIENVTQGILALCSPARGGDTSDSAPLLGGSPASAGYQSIRNPAAQRRARLDPGIVSQTFQLRLDFLREAGMQDQTLDDVLVRGYRASPLVGWWLVLLSALGGFTLGLLNHPGSFFQLFVTMLLVKSFDAVSAGLVLVTAGDDIDLATRVLFVAHMLAAPLGLLLARTFMLSADAPSSQVRAMCEALTSGAFVFSAVGELFSDVFVDWRRRGRKFVLFSLGLLSAFPFCAENGMQRTNSRRLPACRGVSCAESRVWCVCGGGGASPLRANTTSKTRALATACARASFITSSGLFFSGCGLSVMKFKRIEPLPA